MIIILQQKEHEAFKRSGHDLYLEKDITLSEALCGFDMVITHLDKREIKVHCPPGQVIEPGKRFCLFFPFVPNQGPVVQRLDSAIHRIVIFQALLNQSLIGITRLKVYYL